MSRFPPSPTLIVLDYQNRSLTIDGREVAGFHEMLNDIEVDTIDGYFGTVRITLIAANLIVRTESGDTSSPTASDEARRIVRRGLADVLRWLGEEPG